MLFDIDPPSPQRPAETLRRVFLVDDDEGISTLFSRILLHAGYTVDATTSSTAALKTLRAHPEKFDVVVSDYRMPCLNGDELIKQVKENGFLGRTVIFSGFIPRDSEAWRKTMGVDAVVEKSRIHSLVEVLKQLTN